MSRRSADGVDSDAPFYYPPAALREAVANAICHRDYSIAGGSVGIAIFDDRLEVSSPGPLHFGLRAEDLFRPHESLSWNPLIAQAFYCRGMIEMWGRGTLRMAELSRQAGLPQPELEEVAGAVVVRFRPGRCRVSVRFIVECFQWVPRRASG